MTHFFKGSTGCSNEKGLGLVMNKNIDSASDIRINSNVGQRQGIKCEGRPVTP